MACYKIIEIKKLLEGIFNAILLVLLLIINYLKRSAKCKSFWTDELCIQAINLLTKNSFNSFLIEGLKTFR